jgi:hypothetical protein
VDIRGQGPKGVSGLPLIYAVQNQTTFIDEQQEVQTELLLESEHKLEAYRLDIGVKDQVKEDRRSFWRPARDAWVDDDFLWCELDSTHAYELMQAYSRAPHVRFLNAKSDDDLLDFVVTWGPLAIPESAPVGKSRLSIRDYRLFQTELRATNGLLLALQEGKGEGQALTQFLTLAEERQQALSLGAAHMPSTTILNLQMILQDDPLVQPLARRYVDKNTESTRILASRLGWIASASVVALRQAIAHLINKECQLTARLYSNVHSGTVSVQWELHTLEDALVWMVYQSALDTRLPQTCPECRKVFQSETRHAKKFCSPKCAHCCAARRWAAERRQRRAPELFASQKNG